MDRRARKARLAQRPSGFRRHKIADHDDDPRNIAEARSYLRDSIPKPESLERKHRRTMV